MAYTLRWRRYRACCKGGVTGTNTYISENEMKACETFDKGVFNDIMLAYVTNAMYLSEMPKEIADRFLDAMSEELDTHTAGEALTIYRKRSNRW